MSKKSNINRKNNRSDIPVHKSSKRKKHKKRNLTETIETMGQNKLLEPVPRKSHPKAEPNLLKHKKRISKRDVEPPVASKKAFGAVSSDSDPELINASWDLPDDGAEKPHGTSWDNDTTKLRASAPASKMKDASDLSSDLDESESDLDEELTDTQLSALLSNKTDMDDVVYTGDDDESGEVDISPLQSVTETAVLLPKIATPNALITKSADQPKTTNDTITTADCLNIEIPTVFSWNNERELLAEIERRSG
ncbi:uncharacterized protein DEA37_0011921 [Paragonimus westermani]|uniref:Uncharacterized protein n=1 Tax=Paragonimus westermani TaxID=34504 RepID=A0A5J4N6D6_9TREM|nr:uncharacterized protein DEA37_0011921 [Paragonimus westermani]